MLKEPPKHKHLIGSAKTRQLTVTKCLQNGCELMAFYDSKEQKAKVKGMVGDRQVELAKTGKAMSIPQKLSNRDRIRLAAQGTKKKLESRMELNRLKKNQSTDSNN